MASGIILEQGVMKAQEAPCSRVGNVPVTPALRTFVATGHTQHLAGPQTSASMTQFSFDLQQAFFAAHLGQQSSLKRLIPLPSVRPHLHQAKYGDVTQGTVFSCGRAARYNDCEVHGLAITARCDFAQRKYSVLNYIPLVGLSDWLLRDGIDILVEQELSEQQGRLRGMLRQANVSTALLQSIPLRQIASIHFPEDSQAKAQRTASKRFREIVAEIETFASLNRSGNEPATFEWFKSERPKIIGELVKRLSRHDVLGHYFLETLDPEINEATGYICLLREVSTVARPVAEKLGRGLDHSTFAGLCANDLHSSALKIPKGELAMPVVQIGSPTIEHILQSFGSLFGRIGVADPSEDKITKMIATCIGSNKVGPK